MSVVGLPDFFLEEIRTELIDQTLYSDNELYTFTRNAIKQVNFLLRTNGVVITDSGTSVYEYSVSGAPSLDYWQVVKWCVIYNVLNAYYKKMISEGMGISIGLGGERIDSKTSFIGTGMLIKEAKNTFKQKALAYNLTYGQARVIWGTS